jgi:2,4-dienoyl-CoA reductase-like NADH-dependent reductase (Old Yellow Enzyme family)
VRQAVGADFPLALVKRMRTHAGMRACLESGLVQLVSLCRPLIAEPDLLLKLRQDGEYEHACVRCRKCWPKRPGMGGVTCRNAKTLRRLRRPRPEGVEEEQ